MTEQVGGIEYVVDADLRPFIRNSEELDKRLVAVGKSMDDSGQSMKAVEANARSAGKAAADLSSDMAEARKKFADATSAITGTSGSLFSSAEAASAAGRAASTLASDIATANQRFNDATSGIDMAASSMKSVESGSTATATAMTTMAAAVDAANKRFSESTSSADGAGAGIKTAGENAAATSKAIATLADDVTKAGNNFSSAESSIGLSANSMKLADAAAISLARSNDALASGLSNTSASSAAASESMTGVAVAAETEAQAIERIAKTVSNAYPIMNQYSEANDAMVQSGRRATAAQEAQAQAAAKAAAAAKDGAESLSGAERQQARMESSLRNVKKATEEEAVALSKLMARIDPTSAKIRALYVDMDLLTAAFGKGLIGPQQYADAIKKLEGQIDKLEGSTSKTSAGMEVFKFALAPLAAAITAVKVLQWAKDFSALAEEMSVARVQVMRLTEATDGGAANFEALMQVSQRMGTTMAATQKVWAKFAYTLGELGKSDAEIIKLTETVQQLGALGGTSGDQVATAVDAITRATINGTASSRDLITILKQAPEVGRAIATQLGIPLKDLQKGLKDGTINGEDMINALVDGSEKVNAEFAKLPRMVGEAGKAMETAFGNAFLKINDALGASTKLAWIMDKISNGVNITTGNIPEEVKLNALMIERQKLLTGIEKAGKSVLGGLYKSEMEKNLLDVDKQILAIQNQRIEAQKRENSEKAKYNAMMSDPNRTTADGDKAAKDAQKRIDLLKLEGVAKAKEQALQKLGDDATEADKKKAMALAVEEYNLTEQLAAKKKKLREDESAAKKTKSKEEKDALKDAKDAVKHAEENTKAITDMAVALSLAGLKGKELAQAQALMKLNKWATADDIAKMKELALAMDAVNQTAKNKASVEKLDPMAGEAERYRVEMEEIEKLREADFLSHQRYMELKGASEYQHSEAMRKLAEADFARQSFTNQFLMDGINALASATTSTLSGLLSGTMDAKQAMQGFASVILNQAVGAIVELGFAQVKNALVTKTVQAAAGASYAASVAAQVQATSFLASQAAFASTAAIPVVGPAMAPAAATAAFSTAQGLGAPASTFAAAAGRFNGGPVQQGGMYKVNEGGAPEIFNAANGSQYMMPNQRGEVVSNKNATGGGGMSNQFNFYMNAEGDGGSTSGTGSERARQLTDTLGMVCVEVIQRESQQGGLLWESFGNGG